MQQPLTSAYVVRGETGEKGIAWYAAVDSGLEPFTQNGIPLHQSRFRNKLRLFPSEFAAEDFVKNYESSHGKTGMYLKVEPASQQLLESFGSLASDRAGAISSLFADVERILAAFDFSKVQKAMEIFGCSYAGSTAPPPVEELMRVARDVLTSAVIEDNEGFEEIWSKGGFRAWRRKSGLRLSFEVESVQARTNPLQVTHL